MTNDISPGIRQDLNAKQAVATSGGGSRAAVHNNCCSHVSSHSCIRDNAFIAALRSVPCGSVQILDLLMVKQSCLL